MIENPGEFRPPFGSLADSLLTMARDRVRDARHVMRRLAANSNMAAESRGIGSPLDFLRDIARLSDSAITQAESIVVTFAPAPMRPYGTHSGSFEPRLHFLHGMEGSLRFRADIYRLIRNILERLGFPDPLVHETRLGDVHQALRRGDPALLADALGGQSGAFWRLSARLALELARREPIILLSALAGRNESRQKEAELAELCYALIGLAYAVAGTKKDCEGLIEGVVTAALARREALLAASSGTDAELQLAQLYSKMAPHLP
ncbi:hypothetical protein [Chelativorans sp. Marseille-P2723]|uniref:hypothetical protein n=1 Tax=Chelativorans sp. Marseille-P2723 TaxID=2709133 RepID=UPI00156E6479|nr:hypothetical protein [Chelativorans sp. Marseille-P2723]